MLAAVFATLSKCSLVTESIAVNTLIGMKDCSAVY